LGFLFRSTQRINDKGELLIFVTLSDVRFLLIGSDHARTGDELAASFGLRSRELQIQGVIFAQNSRSE
jgi:hypothetical protein